MGWLLGGLCGGGHGPSGNRLVRNAEVFDGGVVGVQLSGPIAVRP